MEDGHCRVPDDEPKVWDLPLLLQFNRECIALCELIAKLYAGMVVGSTLRNIQRQTERWVKRWTSYDIKLGYRLSKVKWNTKK